MPIKYRLSIWLSIFGHIISCYRSVNEYYLVSSIQQSKFFSFWLSTSLPFALCPPFSRLSLSLSPSSIYLYHIRPTLLQSFRTEHSAFGRTIRNSREGNALARSASWLGNMLDFRFHFCIPTGSGRVWAPLPHSPAQVLGNYLAISKLVCLSAAWDPSLDSLRNFFEHAAVQRNVPKVLKGVELQVAARAGYQIDLAKAVGYLCNCLAAWPMMLASCLG